MLHVHWTSPILQKELTDVDAGRSFLRFRRLLDRLQRRRVKIVWTIHNQLPHELRYRDLELELNRLLAERSDAIHVMNSRTQHVLSEVVTLPSERVTTIPHPSYIGVYGAPIASQEARSRFDIAPDERTVLFLGQIRPYKGLDTLIDAVGRLAAEDVAPVTLLLAGAATRETQATLSGMVPHGVRFVSQFDFVPDADIPIWFGAADMAVFPYRSILNSGSMHTSAAFGVPAILPGEAHLSADFGDEAWVSFYDIARPVESLASTIALVPRKSERDLGFDSFNSRLSPWRISTRYHELLDRLTND